MSAYNIGDLEYVFLFYTYTTTRPLVSNFKGDPTNLGDHMEEEIVVINILKQAEIYDVKRIPFARTETGRTTY